MTDTIYSSEDLALSASVHDFFAGFADNTYLNAMEETEDGYEPARWKQICELGWNAVNLPVELDGGGGTLADAALVVREVGHAAFASPLLQTMRAGTVLADLGVGTERGDEIAAVIAGGAPAVLVAPPDRTVSAVRDNDDWQLIGTPPIVEWLAQSSVVAVLVPIAGSDAWLLAAGQSDALIAHALDVTPIDNERASRLELDGLVIPASAVLRTDVTSAAAESALANADLLSASSMVGGTEAVVEMSAAYAKERYQFGQAIGGFQAVRHHLARMVIASDAARLLCDDALMMQPGADATAIARAAAFAAGRSYVEIVLTAAQIHGGIGTTVEHVLHHHFRRAKAMQLRFGKRSNRLRELHAALVVREEGSLW